MPFILEKTKIEKQEVIKRIVKENPIAIGEKVKVLCKFVDIRGVGDAIFILDVKVTESDGDVFCGDVLDLNPFFKTSQFKTMYQTDTPKTIRFSTENIYDLHSTR